MTWLSQHATVIQAGAACVLAFVILWRTTRAEHPDVLKMRALLAGQHTEED